MKSHVLVILKCKASAFVVHSFSLSKLVDGILSLVKSFQFYHFKQGIFCDKTSVLVI